MRGGLKIPACLVTRSLRVSAKPSTTTTLPSRYPVLTHHISYRQCSSRLQEKQDESSQTVETEPVPKKLRSARSDRERAERRRQGRLAHQRIGLDQSVSMNDDNNQDVVIGTVIGEESTQQEQSQSSRDPSSSSDELLIQKKREKYERDQAIMEELQKLKVFITENSNDPRKIAKRIRRVTLDFSSDKTTAAHQSEALRRIVWLCKKIMSEGEWTKFITHGFMIGAMDDLTNHYLNTSILQRMSVEETCDILWVYATLGYRPSKLITMIVSKIDRVFAQCRQIMDACAAASVNTTGNNDQMKSDHNTRWMSDMQKDSFMGIKPDNEEEIRQQAADKNHSNMRVSFAGFYRLAFRNDTFDPTPFKLPLTASELSDIVYSYGSLRIDSGMMIKVFYSICYEHFTKNNRLLDRFLPKDLANLCVGHAMFDVAFQQYEIAWSLNRHLILLGNHIPWTKDEKLNILHYDVCNRYLNRDWRLRLTGSIQRSIDENFIQSLDRKLPPFKDDPFMQSIYDVLVDLLLSDQFFCKNVEGYQLPFSRWESRDEPAIIEPFGVTDFAQLDDINEGTFLTGAAKLRKHSLQCLFNNFVAMNYFEYPDSNHYRVLYIKQIIKQLSCYYPSHLVHMQSGLDPHNKVLHKESY